MPTQWPNVGLTDYAQALIDNLAELSKVSVYQDNVAVVPGTVWADLNVLTAVEQSVVAANWNVSLVGNVAIAGQAFSLAIDASYAGSIFYGFVFYDSSVSQKLGPVIPFVTPITIPAGGVTISQTVNLKFQDCAS